MIFPRACALADVAWAGQAVPWQDDRAGGVPLRDRVSAHLGRLDAAGLEYRPLAGPRPWQQGGTGPRRFRPGYVVEEVTAHLGQLAASEQS
jgi:hexosaminidase